MLRLAACLGVGVDAIQRVGFDVTDGVLRRAGLDYLVCGEILRHADFATSRRPAALRLAPGAAHPLRPALGSLNVTMAAAMALARRCGRRRACPGAKDGTGHRADPAQGSGPSFTCSLPKFSPRRRPMKARGTAPMPPSTMCSLYLMRPERTHSPSRLRAGP